MTQSHAAWIPRKRTPPRQPNPFARFAGWFSRQHVAVKVACAACFVLVVVLAAIAVALPSPKAPTAATAATSIRMDETQKTEADRAALAKAAELNEGVIRAAEAKVANEEKARRDAELDAQRRYFAKAAPAERSRAITTCIDNGRAFWGVSGGECDDDLIDLIQSSTTNPAEAKKLKNVAVGARAASYARNASDGNHEDAAVADVVDALRKAERSTPLELLPRVSAGEAMKDPDAARGKVIQFSGRVVEIRRSQRGLYTVDEGAVMGSGGGAPVVRFVTPYFTGHIVAGTYVTGFGIFVQEYDYQNVANGQTRSLLVVSDLRLPGD
jgi:hypothetical protein